MTNREAMTLEQARDALRESEARNTYVVPTAMLGRWADAIDAHLRAAEPAASNVNPQHIAADIVRFLASRGIECDSLDVLDFVEDRVVPLYLHPSADARDAQRYRWFRDNHYRWNAPYFGDGRWYVPTGERAGGLQVQDAISYETMDAAIDAAMAKENGNG